MSDGAQAIREIARHHLGIETLDARNSDQLDFYNVAVWSVQAALNAAYGAGLAAGAAPEPPSERSGTWARMTVDEAVEHLKSWIDGLDDPADIATLMIHVCGCPRAAVIDGTHIAAELP